MRLRQTYIVARLYSKNKLQPSDMLQSQRSNRLWAQLLFFMCIQLLAIEMVIIVSVDWD